MRMESINPVASTMAQLILSRITHSRSIAQVRATRNRVIAVAIIALRSQRVRIDTLSIVEVRVRPADTSRISKLPLEEAFYLDSIYPIRVDSSLIEVSDATPLSWNGKGTCFLCARI